MTRRRHKNTLCRQDGYSLVEVMIVTSILATIFILIFSTTDVMTRSANAGREKLNALSDSALAAEFMSGELMGASTADTTNYTVSPDGTQLTFYKSKDSVVKGGCVVPIIAGPVIYKFEGGRIYRMQDLSSPADGLYDQAGEKKTLCSNVVSCSFAVHSSGAFVITFAVSYDANHGSPTVSKTVTVKPLNNFVR